MAPQPTAKEQGKMAEELRELRARIGDTQEGMAARYGVFVRTYQRWEAGAGVRPLHLQLARSWAEGKRRGPKR